MEQPPTTKPTTPTTGTPGRTKQPPTGDNHQQAHQPTGAKKNTREQKKKTQKASAGRDGRDKKKGGKAERGKEEEIKGREKGIKQQKG